jgi:hypothetical protein
MTNQNWRAENPGSTGGSPVGGGDLAVANFFSFALLSDVVAASRRNLQASRLRSPDIVIPYEEGWL